MLGDIAKQLLNIAFTILGFKIDISNMAETTRQLTDWSTISNSTLGTLASTLNDVFVPIGLNLLTIFIMIDFIKKAMDIDRISWERVMMTLVRFLFFKMLIQNSYALLNSIMWIANGFITTVMNTIGFYSNSAISIGSTIGDMINNATGMSVLFVFEMMPLIMFILFIVIYLPMMGTFVMVIAQIVTRVIKIIVAFAFAPIPLGIGAWEDGSATGKKFVMNTIALAFEGMIIIICVHIYCIAMAGMATTGTSDSFGVGVGQMIGILMMNGILSTAITTSSQLAEKWVGA